MGPKWWHALTWGFPTSSKQNTTQYNPVNKQQIRMHLSAYSCVSGVGLLHIWIATSDKPTTTSVRVSPTLRTLYSSTGAC